MSKPFRAVVAGLAVIAIVATAGLGYAAFTSSVYVNGSASAGSLDLLIISVTQTTGPSYISTTTTTLPAASVWVWMNNFGPGDTADFAVAIKNFGTLPGTFSVPLDSAIYSSSTTCPSGGGLVSGVPVSIAPGATITVTYFVSASPLLGSSCADQEIGVFVMSLTATAGT